MAKIARTKNSSIRGLRTTAGNYKFHRRVRSCPPELWRRRKSADLANLIVDNLAMAVEMQVKDDIPCIIFLQQT
jgi:hypothetical protein